MIDVCYTPTLTVERFAALPSAWADTIAVNGGMLLARIHPRNNRPEGDGDVLARALVFIPLRVPLGDDDEDSGYLARLTIRTSHVTYDQRDIRRDCAELLRIVLTLPVIELESA